MCIVGREAYTHTHTPCTLFKDFSDELYPRPIRRATETVGPTQNSKICIVK